MTVTNPITGATTTVSNLVTDPAGTATVGTVAGVITADGYSWLVKQVDDPYYILNPAYPLDPDASQYLVYTITSIDLATGDVVLDLSPDVSGDELATKYYFVAGPVTTEPTPTFDGGGLQGYVEVVYGDPGANGRDGALFVPAGNGDPGHTSGPVEHTNYDDISSSNGPGLLIGSVGGNGGNGGDTYASPFSGTDGQPGADGDSVDVTNTAGALIETQGEENHGIYAFSISGRGGDGGSGYGAPTGGDGGASANGGPVTVTNYGDIVTVGDYARGIYGLSRSATGGAGGEQWGLIGASGDGNSGGNGGTVTIINESSGTISTGGLQAHGIYAQSIGGAGGDSGASGNLIVAIGGGGDLGGWGGEVHITNNGQITTTGDFSRGIYAQSIGGGGGSGGDSGGLFALGGGGSIGGYSAAVSVTNGATGEINTTGIGSDGIFAQSVGGSGGGGGDSGGLISIGGDGDSAGDGGQVTISNNGLIVTQGQFARGIVAQSVGGGGGDGGSTGALIASIGGSGAGGGAGDTVTVTNNGTIQTSGNDAPGIFAQSIGGGGGNGGSATTVGLFAGVSVGGSGDTGGDGGEVRVNLQGGDILTGANPYVDDVTGIVNDGENSTGIHAQSVGGGGGNGGSAVTVTAGFMGAVSIAIGGDGGAAGDGGVVTLDRAGGSSNVTTVGDNATGILLESVGGGGGNGGSSVSVAASAGPAAGSLSVSIGGDGGSGGDGGTVTAGNITGTSAANYTLATTGFDGSIRTFGDNSTGFLAQSVGGGGGNGGLSVSVAASAGAGASGSLSIGVGGDGDVGGVGGLVEVGLEGDITTSGDNATAILAQSVGGGGGNGGGSISVGVAAAGGASGGVSVGLGGSGAGGGQGGSVLLATGSGTIETQGDNSTAVIVQSVGGGGGNGGYSVAAALGAGGAAGGGVSVGLGGDAGAGSNGGAVWADIQSDVITGSVLIAESESQTIRTGSVANFFNPTEIFDEEGNLLLGVGTLAEDEAATWAESYDVEIEVTPAHYGENSHGIVVQSIGGGGGNGGFNVSASLGAGGAAGGAVSVGLGGTGGGGGEGGIVNASSSGSITTQGNNSIGFLAQSVGGGGGNGGYNVSAGLGGGGTAGGSINVGLGGAGGDGNLSRKVTAIVSGQVNTMGDNSTGVVAQSLGGGGGNGGFNVSAGIGGGGTAGGAVSVGLGGDGGIGGTGGEVDLTVSNSVTTEGDDAGAIIAQSIGGGGGSGGFNVSAGIGGGGTAGGAINVGLGGAGGDGNFSSLVTALVSGQVNTEGERSTGVLAQSVGGGGGNGGFNVSAGGAGGGTAGGAISVGLGGEGGTAGNGGMVDLDVLNMVVTEGNNSAAIVGQSIGGGGGNGGFNVSAGAAGGGTAGGSINVGLGGGGGAGGYAMGVDVNVTGEVQTYGDSSVGILAQSVGGGGGNGGFNVSAGGAGGETAGGAISVGLGGDGAGGGAGSTVDLNVTNNVTTEGNDSTAVIAQSVGGGGGNGGFNVSAALAGGGSGSGSVSVGLGGSGGVASNSDTVTSSVTGNLTTQGENSAGLLVQSVGGGGGNGGFNVSAAISGATSGPSGSIGVGIGGSGGGGGDGGVVISDFTGTVITSHVLIPETVNSDTGETIEAHYAENAGGIIAQSLGGGGGNGGINVTGTVAFAESYSGAIGVGLGGSGGAGGDGKDVTNTVTGYVQTQGDRSVGVLAQSVGGGGGNGGLNVTGSLSGSKSGSASIGVGIGGFGESGGDGAIVRNTYTGGLLTTGNESTGLVAQSLGGGGGNGGINVTGTINMSQENGASVGVGIGGFGGDGGNANEVYSTVTAGDADDMFVTTGDNSTAIFAQSLGGSGGNGAINVTGAVNLTGKSGAAVGVGVGGFGGGAGNAEMVTLDVTGDVLTLGNNSHGLVAQSIGGGGGNGGTNISGTLAFTNSDTPSSKTAAVSIGVGGFGGGGGTAGDVDVDYAGTIDARPKTWVDEYVDADTGETIAAHYELNEGTGSHGILAQSVGGGGGNGGVNVSAGLSYASTDAVNNGDAYGIMIGVGGFGGEGGDAGNVDVTVTGGESIASHGAGHSAVLAQSLGGGGGNGGTNVSGGISSDSSLIVGVGGFGGDAGVGKDVTVDVTADVYASGNSSGCADITCGLDAVAEEVAAGGDVELSFGAGILAQSIGGGGGNGAVNVSGGIAIAKEGNLPSINVGIGGFGGAGAASGDVGVTHVGNSITTGNWMHGIMAQSIAGGGGNGGMNVSGQLNFADSENSGGKKDLTIVAGIGGNGGAGDDAGDVIITQSGVVTTNGDNSRGVFGQSIGGGGGTGGMNVTGVFAQNSSPISVGVGGSGDSAGNAGFVVINRGDESNAAGAINTNGVNAHGIEASSIGGGGGDAGMNFIMGFTQVGKGNTDPGFAAQFAIGGGGGDAGNGGHAEVNNYSDIETQKDNSHGIMAQSIGGGGGNANINLAVTYADASGNGGLYNKPNENMGFNLAVGGATGDGGHADTVDVVNVGNVETHGKDSYGILAQSIGGGGGNAGMDVAATLVSGKQMGITIGRQGGTGGYGADVTLSSDGVVTTHGTGSYGLLAQSIGNGGGNSSSTSVSAAIPSQQSDTGEVEAQEAKLSIGIEGGSSGRGGDVTLDAAGWVITEGEGAHAIFAQSVGGGGGNGGSANTAGKAAAKLSLSMGGTGGDAGIGGDVTVNSSAQVRTYNDEAVGILAQSIGGGGGNGGAARSGGYKPSSGTAVNVSVGGDGGTGMWGGIVNVDNSGIIITDGYRSHGILAQSIGGGGGNAGTAQYKIVKQSDDVESANRVSITLGGTGGDATEARGGEVNVVNTGGIGTSKANSYGIFAQSVGGGGGSASDVSTGSVTGKGGGNNFSVALGGAGGEGGSGGNVNVWNLAQPGDLNSGKIITVGNSSHGIMAMSIGGGGGVGSQTSTSNGDGFPFTGTAPKSSAASYNFSLGGNGGDGGEGGDVYVENTGTITTYGYQSHGIVALSIGGGGGAGGMAMAHDTVMAPKATDQKAMNMSIGGFGGDGNISGDVTVLNSGTIEVFGDKSYGVYAQSIGGGGGDGGMAVAFSKNLLMNPKTDASGLLGTIGIGGNGGTGADSGNVFVQNTGTIISHGDDSYGIFVQSISGGGGNVGQSISSPAWMLADYGVSTVLGGRDGSGGVAGTVDIDTTGDIFMYGENSQAQLKQSINGGGGNVKMFIDASTKAREIAVGGYTLPDNGGTIDTTVAFIASAIEMGGENVVDAIGSKVQSSLVGSMYTYGSNSIASLVQSIGGGGGNATTLFATDNQANINLELALGGAQALNSGGGDVDDVRTGDVGTIGDQSQGYVIQSVGGGGGNVVVNAIVVDPAPEDDPAQAVAPSGASGSKAVLSAGSKAPTIKYTNASDETSDGDSSAEGSTVAADKLVADASSGVSVSKAVLSAGSKAPTIKYTNASDETSDSDSSAEVAPADKLVADASSNSGPIKATPLAMTPATTIKRTLSGREDELLQAVQQPGAGSMGLLPLYPLVEAPGGPGVAVATAILGSVDSLNNNGGNISSEIAGNLSTVGDYSSGLVVQSIGGGGGQASLTGFDGLNVTLGASGNSTGDGGDILLSNDGWIGTEGELSHGIFLQSIGGGGGAVFTDLDASDVTVSLSSDNSGNGGNISLEQNGTVFVSGDGSIAVLAQTLGGGGGIVDRVFADTAGGAGTSGAIDLTLNGNVIAWGQDGVGVFAQSQGADGQGDINISLTEDHIIYAAEDGVALWLSGGGDNTFTNYGSVFTVDRVLGWAVLGDDGNDFIDNHGTILGQIDLGQGENSFMNNQYMQFIAGPSLSLGAASNQLINAGSMIIGDSMNAQDTVLTGSFTQTAMGHTYSELDFGTGVLDNISMTGTADLNGEVDVSLLNPHLIPFGHFQQTLFGTEMGAIDNGMVLTTAPSVVITYELLYPNGLDAVLDYNVDFSPNGLSSNLTEVGDYFNRIQSVGSFPGLADTVTQLVYDPTMDVYRESLAQLTPDFYGEHQAELIRSSQRFTQILASQGGFGSESGLGASYRGYTAVSAGTAGSGDTGASGSGSQGEGYVSATGSDYRYIGESTSFWLQADMENSKHQANGDYKEVDHSLNRLSMGLNAILDSSWALGMGFAHEENTANGYDGHWESRGTTNHLGVSLIRRYGATDIGFIQSYSWNELDVTRRGAVAYPFTATAQRSLQSYSGILRLSRIMDIGNPYLTATIDLGYNNLSVDDTEETGGAGTSLTLRSNSELQSFLRPSVVTGFQQVLESGATLHWHANFAMQHYLSGGETNVIAGFAAVTNGVDPMQVPIDLGGAYFEGSVGLDLLTREKVSFGIEYSSVFTKENYSEDRWMLNLRVPFR